MYIRVNYEGQLNSFEPDHEGSCRYSIPILWKLVGITSNQIKLCVPHVPHFRVRSPFVFALQSQIWGKNWCRWSSESREPKIILTFQGLKQMPKCWLWVLIAALSKWATSKTHSLEFWHLFQTSEQQSKFWLSALGTLATSILLPILACKSKTNGLRSLSGRIQFAC